MSTPAGSLSLHGLSGQHPVHFLAAIGAAASVPDATLHFTGPSLAPQLTSPMSDHELAETLCRNLWHLLRTRMPELLAGITTTTPSRARVYPLAEASWEDPDADAVSRLYDPTRMKTDKDGTVQVLSSDLTLISGKSYTVRSLTGVPYDEQDLFKDLAALLQGNEISQAASVQSLRFSATIRAPRLTTGREEMEIQPLLEHLALAGQLQLSTHQRELAATAGTGHARRALTWVCNPVALPLKALIDLHESPPEDLPWPRFTSPITQAPGTAMFSLFQPTRTGR